MQSHKRTVGERGQITLPKDLRDRRGIAGGDEIEIVEVDGEILLKLPTDEERLAEGYQARADRDRKLADELRETTAEATDRLGDAPDWDE
jgi:AbrB family looped-hinge helix DNA binding protein